MIRSLIFDVDGVIVDTEKIHFDAFRDILAKYGHDLTLKEFKKHFSGKSIAEEYIYSKPDPECYQEVLLRLNLPSKEVVGIEDSPSGIEALNKADIFSIGLTKTHFKKELREARLITDSLLELL